MSTEHDANKAEIVAAYLRDNIPLREAVQLNKRVEYFRGKRLVEVLLDGNDKKGKPECRSREDALALGKMLLKQQLIHKSEVVDKKKRILRPLNSIEFSEEGYYTWIYEGSRTTRNLLLGFLVACCILITMFPIWPQFAKVGIWYISVTLLIFLVSLLSVRLTLFCLLWSVGFDCWILPNLFDEDLGVADSFRPLYTFSKGEDLKDSWIYRAGMFVAVVSMGYWVLSQPTDFDDFLEKNKQFVNDLYTGNLLSDTSHTGQEEMVIPKLEDLELDDDDYLAENEDGATMNDVEEEET